MHFSIPLCSNTLDDFESPCPLLFLLVFVPKGVTISSYSKSYFKTTYPPLLYARVDHALLGKVTFKTFEFLDFMRPFLTWQSLQITSKDP